MVQLTINPARLLQCDKAGTAFKKVPMCRSFVLIVRGQQRPSPSNSLFHANDACLTDSIGLETFKYVLFIQRYAMSLLGRYPIAKMLTCCLGKLTSVYPKSAHHGQK
jgi:hypothetical protein